MPAILGKSKIARRPISLPPGLDCKIPSPGIISIKDSKGTEHTFQYNHKYIECSVCDSQISIAFNHTLQKLPIKYRGLLGTNVSLVKNFIKGIPSGFTAKAKLTGVGYRATFSANTLTLFIGFSHPVKILTPKSVDIKIEKDTIFLIGPNQTNITNLCQILKKLRKPEPYKGTGIFINNDNIILKQGKKK